MTTWECKCPMCGQIYHRTNIHPNIDPEHRKAFDYHIRYAHLEKDK